MREREDNNVTIFGLHTAVLADYRDCVRSFILIADGRAEAYGLGPAGNQHLRPCDARQMGGRSEPLGGALSCPAPKDGMYNICPCKKDRCPVWYRPWPCIPYSRRS